MIRRPIRLMAAILAVAAVGLTACSSSNTTPGTQAAPRTVNIEMRDVYFSPKTVDIKAGETVRFVFTNKGKVTHDALIGDKKAQIDHEAEMRGMDGMAGMDHGQGHGAKSDEGAVTVKPGKTGETTHTFSAGDQLLIGCHEEGHYAAGMQLKLQMT